jgi:tetratricopeptide (TPR) repeat protein
MVLIPQHCFVRLRTASGVWNYETTQDGKLFAEHVYAFKCPLKGSRGVYLRSLTPREALAAQLATTFGVLLGWEGRYRESLALLDLAVELAPEFTQAWINRSTKLVHLDRPNEALVSADRALALNGHSASAWCARGRALRKLARTAEAVDAFEKALAHDGSHTGARVALAEALAESGQLTTALREINRVLNATPNDGAAMAQKLEILLAMGRDEEAEALRKHLLPDPLTPSGRLYGQATMLANAGHHRKAVPLFDESLRLDPNSYRCWHNKGNSLAVLKRFDEALECFAKSLKLNPDYAMGYAKKAQACVILGRLDEAEEAVSKAVELHPDNAYYARLQIEIKRQR